MDGLMSGEEQTGLEETDTLAAEIADIKSKIKEAHSPKLRGLERQIEKGKEKERLLTVQIQQHREELKEVQADIQRWQHEKSKFCAKIDEIRNLDTRLAAFEKGYAALDAQTQVWVTNETDTGRCSN
jgi:uncharacterized coiled-coil DUF342 family protein